MGGGLVGVLVSNWMGAIGTYMVERSMRSVGGCRVELRGFIRVMSFCCSRRNQDEPIGKSQLRGGLITTPSSSRSKQDMRTATLTGMHPKARPNFKDRRKRGSKFLNMESQGIILILAASMR